MSPNELAGAQSLKPGENGKSLSVALNTVVNPMTAAAVQIFDFWL